MASLLDHLFVPHPRGNGSSTHLTVYSRNKKLKLACRIPIWYDVKLLTVAWLVLPQFEGASYLYDRFVREHIRKYITEREHHQDQQSKKSSNESKAKKKFVEFVTPKKVS
ncbi:Protein HVA22, partial [Mucuna pruriens]